ncbi:FCD domain-containing protein [Aneurinibacillus tyrosinisolvens]|uniref:FCD domain-containing protein n=1 Tax=Aneurinibacillus tyrosinisolvens TaxID=1443435 RepID=UPI0022A97876|nr:FCD domain-containing protein [Aneurinibacillus tyrosinisolvens]
MRALMEGEAAARASRYGEDFTSIFLALEKTEQAAQSGDVAAYVSANDEFHHAIWKTGKGQRLETLLHQIWNGLPTRLPELLTEQIERSLSEHKQLVKVISERKADEARATMSHHIMRSFHDFVASREHTQQAPTQAEGKGE